MNPDHPLITPPVLDAWLDVPATGAVMSTVVEQLYDFHLAHQLDWPAHDRDGHLVPPPDEHILDHLVRVHELLGPEAELYNPDLVGVGAMAVIETSRTEICDLCPGTGRYSAFIQCEGRRQHGVLCDSCYDRHVTDDSASATTCTCSLRTRCPRRCGLSARC